MAKKKHTKRSGMAFCVGMALYAVLFLTATGFGLKWFWGFIEAYEASRPHIAIDQYMDELTREHILESCDDLLEQVDFNIQSEERCRQIMLDAISEEITYARKASACTDTQQVYVLKSGKQVIGSFTIGAEEEDSYGFRPWRFVEDSFDLSFLMNSEILRVQAPEGYAVYVGGVQLDERYIVEQERTPFELLEDFYKDYDLPEFVLNTYEAGPFLSETFQMNVYDPQGFSFTYDETFDKNSMIQYADEEMVAKLGNFVEEFVDVFVIFSGCANDNRYGNYQKVIQYVVPGSNLARRMQEALDGMMYAQSKGDEVESVTVHHYVKLDEGTYLCDVTYLVNTTGHEGVVQTTTNARLLICEQNGKLLVESMIHY